MHRRRSDAARKHDGPSRIYIPRTLLFEEQRLHVRERVRLRRRHDCESTSRPSRHVDAGGGGTVVWLWPTCFWNAFPFCTPGPCVLSSSESIADDVRLVQSALHLLEERALRFARLRPVLEFFALSPRRSCSRRWMRRTMCRSAASPVRTISCDATTTTRRTTLTSLLPRAASRRPSRWRCVSSSSRRKLRASCARPWFLSLPISSSTLPCARSSNAFSSPRPAQLYSNRPARETHGRSAFSLRSVDLPGYDTRHHERRRHQSRRKVRTPIR